MNMKDLESYYPCKISCNEILELIDTLERYGLNYKAMSLISDLESEYRNMKNRQKEIVMFIDMIPDPITQEIFKQRIYDRQSWKAISRNMYGLYASEGTCKQQASRYIKRYNSRTGYRA